MTSARYIPNWEGANAHFERLALASPESYLTIKTPQLHDGRLMAALDELYI